jgi:tetratricopeptide (TPR) repeat protein
MLSAIVLSLAMLTGADKAEPINNSNYQPTPIVQTIPTHQDSLDLMVEKYQSGRAANKDHNYEEAIELFNESLELYHKIGEGNTEMKSLLHEKLGNTYLDLEEYDKAVIEHEEALKAAPYKLINSNNLAYALAKNNQDLDYAEKLATLYTQIEPNIGEGFGTLGLIKFMQKDYEQAEILIQKGLQLIPESRTESKILNYETLIDIYQATGNVEKQQDCQMNLDLLYQQ